MSVAFAVPAWPPVPPHDDGVAPERDHGTYRKPVDDTEPPLVSVVRPLMGGTVGVHVRPADGGMTASIEARRAAGSIVGRLGAWADRLTRFSETSDLTRLNATRSRRVPVRPTLAATLDWARQAEGLSDGIVDVTLLDARLAAELPDHRATQQIGRAHV